MLMEGASISCSGATWKEDDPRPDGVWDVASLRLPDALFPSKSFAQSSENNNGMVFKEAAFGCP